MLLAVEGVALAAHLAHRVVERRSVGNGVLGATFHAVHKEAVEVALRQPGEDRLAERGRMRRLDAANAASIHAHGMPRILHGQHDDRVALQRRKVDGLAGRRVDLLQIGVGPARQIDLQAGVAEIDDAGAERIEPAARDLGHEAALDQRGQKMMAGRDVEAGTVRQVGERGLAAGFSDGLEQVQRPVDGLDAVPFAFGAHARRADL